MVMSGQRMNTLTMISTGVYQYSEDTSALPSIVVRVFVPLGGGVVERNSTRPKNF